MTGYAIGIDLGTTNCLLAVFRDGRVEIIENDSGQRSTPAFVTFTENERLIGEVAKNLVVDEPENTVYDVKRLLGTRFDDQRIQDDIRRWTFNVCGSDDDDGMPNIGVKFQSEVRKFRPEEISAMILEKMKQIAETFLEEEVSRAVISVPAYFSDSQRQATIDSAKIAGLEVLGLVNEPTAAAFCYGMKKKKGRDCKNVLLFDLGSGTFNVSMVHIDDGQFTVKSTVGDCHFGGNDFDNALVDWCLKNFKMQHRLDPSTDKRAMQRLRTECERAKITLSTSNQTSISVDYLYSQQHFSMSITRAQFEVLCRRYFLRILSLVDDVILEAGIPKREIDDIVLVGGCTRIPKIRQLLQDYFQVKEIKHSVNPDLAVVHGAAIQAAILNGHIDCPQWKLVDVCSHSFGIGVSCGRIVTAVKRHTKIPVANEISLVTSHDDQANVMFKIYEGEHVLAKNNNFLGQFKIVDIPPAPKGEETIRLTFEIDSNGILNVSASLSSTSNSQKLVRKQCCLTNEQIEEKREVAKWFQQADQQYRDKIVQKNLLETVLYEIKSKLELITTIITADDRQSIQTKLDQLENCFIKEDKEGRMKSITEQEIVDQRNDLIQIYQSIIDKYFMLKSQ